MSSTNLSGILSRLYGTPPALQSDARKTINSTALGVADPAPALLQPSSADYTVGQKYQGSNAPVLDWNTFEQQLLQPMLSGSRPSYDTRGTWGPQLGLDIGGKGGAEIVGYDPSQTYMGTSTGNLDDMGMPAYYAQTAEQAAAGAAQRQADYQKYINDPNTLYSIYGDAINPDGTTSGGRDRSQTQYKRVGNQLIPVNTRNYQTSSMTADALKGGLMLAGAVYGLSGLEGLSGSGGLSGMDLAADAGIGSGNNIMTAGSMLGDPALIAGTGIPQFQQLPGYGNNVATLADASGNSPFTQGFDPLSDYMTSGGAEGSLVDSGVTAATPYDNLLPYTMGATNATAPSLWDSAKGWLGNLMSGDKTALNQARMGLGAVGLIGQLLQGNEPRNQLTPGQLQAAVKGPHDKWTGGNQAAFDKFAGTDLSKFQFTPPRLAHGGPAPHDAHCRCTMCSGGAVSSYARGSLVRGPGGGQDDQVHAMLSPGEYVMDADTVSALGDGDNATGADKLDQMRENIRAHKRSAPPSKIPPRARAPEHYLHKKGR